LLIAVLIGVCVPMFNIAAVWPMTRHAQTGFVRQLVRNPLIVATFAGLLANLLGFTVPTWLTPTLTRIGAASLALGLLAAGAGMQFATLGRGKVLAVSVLAIRHLILPLVAWGLATRAATRRDSGVGADGLFGSADRVERLCARGAHGLQRAVCGGAGDAVDGAGGGEPAVRAGVAEIAQRCINAGTADASIATPDAVSNPSTSFLNAVSLIPI
jgi:hypothetical protein